MKYNAFPIIVLLLATACATQRPSVDRAPDHRAMLAHHGVDAVLWQNTSAEVYWLYEQAYEHALIKLVTNLAAVRLRYPDDAPQRPNAVIVDIDETVLENSPYQIGAITRGRTFDPLDWKQWTDKASALASPGALGFLKAVEAAKCEVFYITNRDTSERAATLKNLRELGFPFADEEHLLLMAGSSDKTARRAQVNATHHVVLFVGDQLTDFDERLKDRSHDYGRDVVKAMSDSLARYFILLPNPMYGAYRDGIRGKGSDAERHERTMRWFKDQGH